MEIPGGVKCAADQLTIQMIPSCLFISIFSISAALIWDFCLLSSFDVKTEVVLLPQLMLGLGSLMCLDRRSYLCNNAFSPYKLLIIGWKYLIRSFDQQSGPSSPVGLLMSLATSKSEATCVIRKATAS